MSRVLGNLLRRQVSSGTRIIAASSWISDALPFGLWYDGPEAVVNAISYAKVSQPVTHHAVIRVYDDAGKGGRPPLVAPNIEGGAIPVPDAHSCVLGAPF
jgi:hypothetical protein